MPSFQRGDHGGRRGDRHALGAGDASLPANLRDVLSDAGYTAAALREALTATGEGLSPRPEQIPPVLFLLGDSRLHDLIRLFVLDQTLPADRATAALRPLTPDRAVAAGLLRRDSNGYAAEYRIVPSSDYVFVVDPPAKEAEREFVMGVTASSTALAQLTVRRPVDTTLDLGTGCGVQAIMAAAHSQRVVATDVNGRALAVASFNAELNGIGHIDVRSGSLFEPVDGQRFDLIVANPPFVISPDAALLYRDGESEGDSLSRSIVEAAAAHLNDGGIAHVMINWVHSQSDWAAPLRRWVDDRGCDAVLLRFSSDIPLEYAANWSAAHARDATDHAATIQRWMAYFERLDVEAISYGAVVLRRREGQNWTRADDVPGGPVAPAGDQLWRLFETTTRLVGLPEPASLFDAVLRVTERHRLEQVLRREGNGYAVASATIHLEEGLPFRASLDAVTATMLAQIDGRRRLSEAMAAAAASVGTDGQALADAALPVVRRMLETGILSWE